MCHVLRKWEYCRDLNIANNELPCGEILLEKLLQAIISSDNISALLRKISHTKCCTLHHLAEVVNAESVRPICSIVSLLRECLGNLQRRTVSSDITAIFIDISSVFDCIMREFTVHRPHKLLVQVMAFIEGTKLDDCLVVFIRRVFEELDHARKSTNRIVASHVGIAVKDAVKYYVQEFTMEDIRMRRQLVLAALKSGIIDGGEVYIDYYLQINHTLPLCLDTTAGYVHVRRKYHFCFKDLNAKSYRFFSSQPLEPLFSGVFYLEEDVTLYCQAIRTHIAKEKNSTTILLKYYAELYLQRFRDGHFVDAVQYLFMISCLMDSPRISMTQQLSFFLTSDAAMANSIVDAIIALRVTIKQIIIFLRSSTGSETDPAKRTLADDIYDTVHPSLVEIRHYVLGACRQLTGSDGSFVRGYVNNVLSELFYADSADQPRLPTSFDVSQTRRTHSDRISDYCYRLLDLDGALDRLETAFTFLMASISLDILSYLLHFNHMQDTKISKPGRGFHIKPTNVAELVGYIEALSGSLKSWQRYQPSDVSLLLILQNTEAENSQRRSICECMRLDNLAENRKIENQIISRDFIDMQSLLESFDGLGINWGGRLGVIAIDVCNKEELLLDTFPDSFAVSGSLIRYVIETKLYNYICNGYFDILSEGQMQNAYCLINREMHLAAAASAIWRIPDAEITDKLYQSSSIFLDEHECFKLPLDSTLQGGIFGPELPLRIISPSAHRLHQLAYLLPPVVCAGVSGCEYFCGISLSSALRWGIASSDFAETAPQNIPSIMRETSFVSSSVAFSETQASQAPLHVDGAEIASHDHTFMPGSIDLEVVSLFQLSSAGSIATVKQKFGEEVEHLVRFLQQHKHWNVTQAIVVSSSGRQYKFATSRLLEDAEYMLSMRKRAAREGIITIETSVLVYDPCCSNDGATNALDQLISIIRANDSSDSTLNDDSRIYHDGYISQMLASQREGTHIVYAPCTVTIQLLASMVGLHIPMDDSSNHFLLKKQRQQFVLGSDAIVAKLTTSTLWFSPTSARTLWGYIDKSVRECTDYQRHQNLHVFEMYRDNKNLIDACDRLRIVQLLSEEENIPLQQEKIAFSYRVTKISGLGRLRSIIETIRIVRYMIDQSTSSALDYIALANTIIRHICLACRKVVLLEECVSFRGGCVLLLHKLCQLEDCLCLGKLNLFNNDTTLPHPPLSKEYAEELWERNLTPDAVSEFKASVGRAMASSIALPIVLLNDIENMCEVLLHSLTDNMLTNVPHWFWQGTDCVARNISPAGDSDHLDISSIIDISQVTDDQRSELRYHAQANYDLRSIHSPISSGASTVRSEVDASDTHAALSSALHDRARDIDAFDGPPEIPVRRRVVQQGKSDMLHTLRHK